MFCKESGTTRMLCHRYPSAPQRIGRCFASSRQQMCLVFRTFRTMPTVRRQFLELVCLVEQISESQLCTRVSRSGTYITRTVAGLRASSAEIALISIVSIPSCLLCDHSKRCRGSSSSVPPLFPFIDSELHNLEAFLKSINGWRSAVRLRNAAIFQEMVRDW